MKKIIILIPIIVLISVLFLFIRRDFRELNKYYKNMDLKNISGYVIDLRISEIENQESYRITNYKNEQIIFVDIVNKPEKVYIKEEEQVSQYSNVFELEAENIDFDIIGYGKILDSLTNVKKVTSKKTETIGDRKYIVFDVVLNNKHIESLVEEFKIEGDFNDTKAKIYILGNYVSKIEVSNDQTKITASYFNVDNVRYMNLNNNFDLE